MVTLQIVAFPQEGPLPERRGAAGRGVKAGRRRGGRSRTSSSPASMAYSRCISLLNWRRSADRPLDIHCDEIDDEQSRFVETVAALASMRPALPARDGW